MHFCRLTAHDVVRHKLVGRIVERTAYDAELSDGEVDARTTRDGSMNVEVNNESGVEIDDTDCCGSPGS